MGGDEGKAAGVRAWITKPFQPAVLATTASPVRRSVRGYLN